MNNLIITQVEEKIKVSGAGVFSASQTFECGQCFRFDKNENGEYEGVATDSPSASGHFARISNSDDGEVLFSGTTMDEVKNFWISFLDLERDYEKIVSTYSEDSHIGVAARTCSGIRILKQDPWEALCSFIISQNNNIPRIKKIIRSLCENFGEKTKSGHFTFPDARVLAEAESLAVIRSGFREKYIKDAAQKVADGEIKLEVLKMMPYEQAKAELMRIKGVGEKVSSCVSLFGLGFLGAFPVDVWIKRVLEKHYDADFDPSSFGEYAGVAQQYLFHYERYYASDE